MTSKYEENEMAKKLERLVNIGLIAFGFFVLGVSIHFVVSTFDPLCIPQGRYSVLFASNELFCTNVAISEGVGSSGDVGFNMTFRNPYSGGLRVSKYPKEEGEEITVVGEDIVWRGVSNLSEKQRNSTNAIVVSLLYWSENFACSHFYYLKCPMLESKIKEIRSEWTNKNQKTKIGLYTLLSYMAALTLFVYAVLMYFVQS